MKNLDPNRLVKIEVPLPAALDQTCHERWELTDRKLGDLAFLVDLTERGEQANQWRYWCHEHEVEVPLKATECPGRRFISAGVHEVPFSMAEVLVQREAASFLVEEVASRPDDDSRINQTLRQKGLPAVSAVDLDFMRQVVASKPKSKLLQPGASPSKIPDLSQDDLTDMREVLKDLRGRK